MGLDVILLRDHKGRGKRLPPQLRALGQNMLPFSASCHPQASRATFINTQELGDDSDTCTCTSASAEQAVRGIR